MLTRTSVTLCALLLMMQVPTTRSAIESNHLSDPTAGTFLVADSVMTDPRFTKTVILLVEHDDKGSWGFIINRPTEVTLAEALPELDQQWSTLHTLFFGGPVEPRRLYYLYRSADEPKVDAGIDDLFWDASPERLAALIVDDDPGENLHIFFGYVGWGPGQLQFELALGSWKVVPATAEQVFSDEIRTLWRRLNSRSRGILTKLDRSPDQPATG